MTVSIQELFRYSLAIVILVSFIAMIVCFLIGLKNKNYAKAKIINRPGDRYHQRIYNKRCKVYKVIDDSQFMYGFLVYLEGNWEIISPKFCVPAGEK